MHFFDDETVLLHFDTFAPRFEGDERVARVRFSIPAEKTKDLTLPSELIEALETFERQVFIKSTVLSFQVPGRNVNFRAAPGVPTVQHFGDVRLSNFRLKRVDGIIMMSFEAEMPLGPGTMGWICQNYGNDVYAEFEEANPELFQSSEPETPKSRSAKRESEAAGKAAEARHESRSPRKRKQELEMDEPDVALPIV